jgi:hypothetical protein
VTVDSIDDALAKVERLGGSVKVEKADVPGMGSYAAVIDSGGSEIGLWEDLPARDDRVGSLRGARPLRLCISDALFVAPNLAVIRPLDDDAPAKQPLVPCRTLWLRTVRRGGRAVAVAFHGDSHDRAVAVGRCDDRFEAQRHVLWPVDHRRLPDAFEQRRAESLLIAGRRHLEQPADV